MIVTKILFAQVEIYLPDKTRLCERDIILYELMSSNMSHLQKKFVKICLEFALKEYIQHAAILKNEIIVNVLVEQNH